MYNQSSPMFLRSVVVVLFLCTRSEHAHADMSAVRRLAAVPAAVQAALLVPSVVLPVRTGTRRRRSLPRRRWRWPWSAPCLWLAASG